uniref:Uncharacterized protein n=1 Tax=Globisporangium ultimum (strain ATCC 200006 / CBS 805.95 / DAOM BR144) TaxID=431595 RepID=K3WP37_GLOUD
MRAKGSEGGSCATKLAGMQTNLAEQLAWIEKMPKNALQQCLNSHVINAYLQSRSVRKAGLVHEDAFAVLLG